MRTPRFMIIESTNYARDAITAFRDQLASYRGLEHPPKDLEWEIRLYDYMLEDPEQRMREYNDVRFQPEYGIISKREVVKQLGWVIE